MKCFSTEYNFLQAKSGKLFTVLYSPECIDSLGGILYIHPFAEELNKSRRIVAMQSRALAELGYNVMTVDLYGCGDSEGELFEADWNKWIQDLKFCREWLESRTNGPVSLWGLRIGALIALQLAQNIEVDIPRIIMWQPVINGKMMLTEFLRIFLASEIFGVGKRKTSINELREKLNAQETLELSGYHLNPNIAHAIDNLSITEFNRNDIELIWLDSVRDKTRPLSISTKNAISDLRNKNINIKYSRVQCEPFWSTGEICECSEIVYVTCDMLKQNINHYDRARI